jgi:hypothetical protein
MDGIYGKGSLFVGCRLGVIDVAAGTSSWSICTRLASISSVELGYAREVTPRTVKARDQAELSVGLTVRPPLPGYPHR